MNTIRVVGIDIAKSVFQVCVWMTDGSVAWNKKVSRQKLLDTVRQFPPSTLIVMEACSTSHFWGRTLQSMGYEVRLIPAQHVKAFVRHQKNDANDALAICETACRPELHFFSVKSTEHRISKPCEAPVSLWLNREPRWLTSFVLCSQNMASLFRSGSSVFNSSYLILLKMHPIALHSRCVVYSPLCGKICWP